MKALNIHGYHGAPMNGAYHALKKLGCEIISPALDYDADAPEKILGRLQYMVKECQPDIIIGTSLGGFFAAVLSVRMKLPVVLVNPCLMAFWHLPKLGYTGPVQPFIRLFGELAGLENRFVSAIVGERDEVIDTHAFTETICGNSRYRVIPKGRHSGGTLPLRKYFEEVLFGQEETDIQE